MNFAVVGVHHIWFFQAPNRREARRRANFISWADKQGNLDVFHGFSSCDGVWEARGYQVENPLGLVEGRDITIIPGVPDVDAIYVTRIQKERGSER